MPWRAPLKFGANLRVNVAPCVPSQGSHIILGFVKFESSAIFLEFDFQPHAGRIDLELFTIRCPLFPAQEMERDDPSTSSARSVVRAGFALCLFASACANRLRLSCWLRSPRRDDSVAMFASPGFALDRIWLNVGSNLLCLACLWRVRLMVVIGEERLWGLEGKSTYGRVDYLSRLNS